MTEDRSARAGGQPGPNPNVQYLPVNLIRPEDGLGRKRDRRGHEDLCRSIEQFGVLTPVTVREAPDGSGEYLLIKGQGRTLACRLIGIDRIPALVVNESYVDTEKVQQFLVENVARLRFKGVDRAILIANARRQGEETSEVARRFGVSPSTVRRLEMQLVGASSGEVAALRAGELNLAVHATIAKHVAPNERAEVISCVVRHATGAKDLDILLRAISWPSLASIQQAPTSSTRLELLEWACRTLARLPKGTPKERIGQLALLMPLTLSQRSCATEEDAG